MADYHKPLPTPIPDTQPFWDAARRHELLVPFCLDCQRHFFYPRRLCPHCLGERIEWRKASGRGRVYSFTVQYRAAHPAFAADVPFVSAVVELDEGVRLATNLVDVEPDPAKLRCDMPVEVVFDDVTPEVTLPKFRPVAEVER